MESNLIFDFAGYQESVVLRRCEPSGMFAPFLKGCIDRKSYDKLARKSQPLKLCPIRDRLDATWYSRLRGAVGLTLRHGANLFPAYKFYINEYLIDEWLAAVDWHKGFHRDHVIHQPMSAYVGMRLLKDLDLGLRKSLLELSVERIFTSSKCSYLLEYAREMGASKEYLDDSIHARKLWEGLLVDTFFLAALFHDMGYPWSFVNKIHDALDHNSPIENPEGKGHDWIAERYRDRLVFYPINGYRKTDHSAPAHWSRVHGEIIKNGLNNTHGMPGAIAMLHLNDLIRVHPPLLGDKPMRRFCIEWAAMSVMMHDLVSLYASVGEGNINVKHPHLRVTFDQDPLSFLMTLTDQIQDFERPNAGFQRSSGDVNVKYFARCRSVDVKWHSSDRKLTITYRYNNHDDYRINQLKFLPENELKYYHPKTGYLDYSSLGINRIQLLAVKV